MKATNIGAMLLSGFGGSPFLLACSQTPSPATTAQVASNSSVPSPAPTAQATSNASATSPALASPASAASAPESRWIYREKKDLVTEQIEYSAGALLSNEGSNGGGIEIEFKCPSTREGATATVEISTFGSDEKGVRIIGDLGLRFNGAVLKPLSKGESKYSNSTTYPIDTLNSVAVFRRFQDEKPFAEATGIAAFGLALGSMRNPSAAAKVSQVNLDLMMMQTVLQSSASDSKADALDPIARARRYLRRIWDPAFAISVDTETVGEMQVAFSLHEEAIAKVLTRCGFEFGNLPDEAQWQAARRAAVAAEESDKKALEDSKKKQLELQEAERREVADKQAKREQAIRDDPASLLSNSAKGEVVK